MIAIAAGVSDGLGYGDNAKAAIITRGMAEMSRLGEAFGALPRTYMGMAGMGDLVATCTSIHSRNRRAGEMIATGVPTPWIEQEIGEVAEGLTAAPVVRDVARERGIELPITEAVCDVAFGGVAAAGRPGRVDGQGAGGGVTLDGPPTGPAPRVCRSRRPRSRNVTSRRCGECAPEGLTPGSPLRTAYERAMTAEWPHDDACWHVTSAVEPAPSIDEHGLDWSRMGATGGVRSRWLHRTGTAFYGPEMPAVFLCGTWDDVELFRGLRRAAALVRTSGR